MRWIDGHCDVLWKMWEDPTKDFYKADEQLDVTYSSLIQSHVKMQVFAVFVPPTVRQGQRFREGLRQIDIFYRKIIGDEDKMVVLSSMDELDHLSDDQCAAFLSLEGAEALEGDLTLLHIFYRLGVRQLGLTWNFANEVADGILEDRGGGLTGFGRKLLKEMERLQMIVDVSHLSDKAFWEIIEDVDLPILASHSNCRAICSHKRNLTDEQIQAIMMKGGIIGINFVPYFVAEEEPKIADILRHIDHILSMGGEDVIFFGSDFDGVAKKIPGLENMQQLDQLKKELLDRYPEELVRKWGFENAYRFYEKSLRRKNEKEELPQKRESSKENC